MKKSLNPLLCVIKLIIPIIVVGLISGCSRVEKIRALEGDISTPYQTLATLEVSRSAIIPAPKTFNHWLYKILTVGFWKVPSRSELIRRDLMNLLKQKARDHYGADAIIKVTYWPALNSESFPRGLVYARGQLIRYEPFPTMLEANEKKPSIQTAASNSDSAVS